MDQAIWYPDIYGSGHFISGYIWARLFYARAQKVCESRGGRPGLPVPNSPHGLCGRKATFKSKYPTRLKYISSPALVLKVHEYKIMVQISTN